MDLGFAASRLAAISFSSIARAISLTREYAVPGTADEPFADPVPLDTLVVGNFDERLWGSGAGSGSGSGSGNCPGTTNRSRDTDREDSSGRAVGRIALLCGTWTSKEGGKGICGNYSGHPKVNLEQGYQPEDVLE